MNARSHHLLYAMDRLLAMLLLMATLPLTALVAVVTLCLCRRSPFVAHLRVGKNGEPFRIWKFRTMWGAVVQVDELELKGKNDPRITSGWARLCRKYSLDELPQLAQVVLGKMSLVGPRPITRKE